MSHMTNLGPCSICLEMDGDESCALEIGCLIQLHMGHADWVPVQDANAGHIDPDDLGWQQICHMAPPEAQGCQGSIFSAL